MKKFKGPFETPIRVVHYQRRPHQGRNYFSIERLFATVRKHFPPSVKCDVAICRFESHGIFRRLYLIIEAMLRQGAVNHVTGDVHFLTLLLRKKRTILTVPDCGIVENSRGLKRKAYLYFWYVFPVKRCALVTVISEAVKQELLSYVDCDPERIRVIYVPISEDFEFAPKEFNAQKPRILQVGTRENKNLLRVAQALRGVSCHLRIIGRLSPEQEEALAQNAIEYSNAFDLSDEDVLKEYRDSDMLLFASTYEGFGMPIAEANAMGRPVVTSNVSPMPEVAADAACLVDPFSVESIREGVARVLTDSPYRCALITRGLENANRFRASAIANQYVKIYEEIVRK